MEFPKIYKDPKLVIGSRDRTREKYRAPPNYKQINYSSDLTDRKQDIEKLNEVRETCVNQKEVRGICVR